jgi:tRNA(Ile)-lysidine synthase
MPDDVIKQIRCTVEKYRMLEPRDKVIVAISGGPDSVALLSALRHLSESYELSLLLAHLNHGLRGAQADQEEAFVRQVGESTGLICETLKLDIQTIRRNGKKSIEETAREERFRFLEQVRGRHGAHKIALGHHRRDQSETVLMNLLRGSGAEGLKGMLPVRDGIYIRPLIELSKDQILAFLRSEGLPFMMDDSNTDDRYLRNRIRHRLLPELKEGYNPRLEENLCRTAEIIRLEDDYLQREVRRICDDSRIVRTNPADLETRISIPELLCLHEALQNRLIKRLLLKCAKTHRGIGYVHIQAVRDFVEAPRSSGFLNFPLDLELRREYDQLVIGRRILPPRRRIMTAGPPGQALPGQLQDNAFADFAQDIVVPGVINIPGGRSSLRFAFAEEPPVRFDCPRTAYMDYDRIVPPLTLRFPRPGEKIQPLGMFGTKKLKNIFIDRKIPLTDRKRTPLLADARSVIWIVGSVLSDRMKITGETTNILKIEII